MRHGSRLAAALIALTALWARPLGSQGTPDVTHMRFMPAVVPQHQTDPVTFEATVSNLPASVAFEYNGVDRPMFDNGQNGDRVANDGIWTIRFQPNEILDKVTPGSVFRPFIGFCEPAGGGRFNIFAEVWTPAIGLTPVQALNGTTQRTKYLVNIAPTAAELQTPDYRVFAQRFYQFFADRFDFLNFVYIAGRRGNRFHSTVSNDVQGTGVSIMDASAQYGSAGRLKGLNVFPLSSLFDLATRGSNHEVGHQWINFLSATTFAGGIPHWPKGNVGTNVMGISLPGGVGGQFPFSFTPNGGGGYVVGSITQETMAGFNPMELYLMGLVPPSEVGTMFVLNDQNLSLTPGQVLQPSQVTHVAVNDVIAVRGARVPDSSASQKSFSVASIVLSDQLLDAYAMSFFDWFARRAESTTTMACAEGFSQYTCKPFHVATGGRATMTSRISLPFTDEPLVSGVTPIRAVHVTELRSRVEAARAERGLAAYGYTDAVPGAGTLILARHVTELRSALIEVYAAAGLTTPVFTDPVLSGVPIRAVHITQLREALRAIE